MATKPTIAVLGASGLIGSEIAATLIRSGFAVSPMARRFTPAQRHVFGAAATTAPLVALTASGLADLIGEADADIVVNCVGVLQDGPRGHAEDVHRDFVARLIEVIAARRTPTLLIQISIPGHAQDDATAFSQSKRAAERLIAASASPYLILRPGFVVAPAAYGGGALMRALAATPFSLNAPDGDRPFAAIAIGDVCATVAEVVRRWRAGERDWGATWDLVERRARSVNGVIDAMRVRFGGPPARIALPRWLLDLGARGGDAAARLGWTPPIRSTALREMRRGVTGDPDPWIDRLGLEPKPLAAMLAELPATAQEGWFARLYLLKPLVVGGLAVFWIASGLVGLTAGAAAASELLVAHGFPYGLAVAIVAAGSLVDCSIGVLIAWHRTCRLGLAGAIGVMFAYLIGASLIAPQLWLDPLGPLVKAIPAILLALVALAIDDDR
jgi:uncharacterized protein YbjT (DUF2867 family)